MQTFCLTIQAAPAAGGGVSYVDYEAETAEQAVELFWKDVDAYGLLVARVIRVNNANGE